jgi:dynein heavy chain
MNPGYAGRTELPENLKVLFRSCAMIRPDLKPICENMLMSEGFMTADMLAIKFVTLYQLSSELLSPQPHYDWGLRAVKSVLRVAGDYKRAEPTVTEDRILMRALRDFNTPKIPAHDTPIFLRLIADLFMGIEVPSKVNEGLKSDAVKCSKFRGNQHDDSFVLKVSQYQELIDVRHSVMLLGPTGCGKSEIWKSLCDTHNMNKDPEVEGFWKKKSTCVYETVNPKSVTSNELYGYMTLAKDWKDGVLSIIMRGMAKCYAEQGFHQFQTYKWVLLDGDIDAVWIESMNTVMDDNKVLTLVSNERIPLSKAMRMIFEINSLKNATPATVSRAGILYINEGDIGWRPFMESWVSRREDDQEKSYLPGLFDRYIEPTVDMIRKGFKKCTPIRLINMVSTICYLLEGLLETVAPEAKTQDVIENYFVYAHTWAFGGPLLADKSGDYRKNFHETFSAQFTNVKYPKEGTCFDYYFDPESGEMSDWKSQVPKYVPLNIGSKPGETPFTSLVVNTADSVRISFLLDTLVKRKRGVMLCGAAGTGKTTIIKDYLNNMGEDWLSNVISMNYFTDSAALQAQLELPIDKRSGRMFGPPATKRLVYFLDDLNLPYVEEYGTQNSLALLVQQMDHGTIFDREDLGMRKEIVDVQYLTAMNPTAGSFTVCERNQRHFATFACLMPSDDDLRSIYYSIFGGHLNHFENKVAALDERIATFAIDLNNKVMAAFLPSAVKFVYNWNMRELTNIFQGMCLSTSENFTTPVSMLRLLTHEATRVFSDRMVSEQEQERFNVILTDMVGKSFNEFPQDEILAQPNVHTDFAIGNSREYLPVDSMAQLNKVLEARLLEYNESNSIMDLVLFGDAMQHVSRIVRILANPAGNAMLIGVGGSGKQSLARLASFINGMEVRQLQVTSSFTVDELKENLQEMYKLAGVKGTPLVFMLTDAQIVNEKFLVYINNMLSSGWIPDLFARDEVDALLGGIRNEAKAAGIVDTPDSMMDFLIHRIRAYMHIVLCFSPVGQVFRVRARRFPGLVNATIIDWFHSWPQDALVEVSKKFLLEEDLGADEVKAGVGMHMATVHLTVTEASEQYRIQQRRFNYVTPKSYLELISFYRGLLADKRGQVQHQIDRLDVGLSTMRKTSQDVDELQVDLKHTMIKVAEKVEATDALIAEMGVATKIAIEEQDKAGVEEVAATKASGEAAIIEAEADAELSEAKPAMMAAADAVDCLSKAMLSELKNLGKPPAGVDQVTKCCLIMIEGEYKNFKWDRAKKMMANVDTFKQRLLEYDGEKIEDHIIDKITPTVTDPDFNFEFMSSKSAAAANLCNWVVNIYKFNRIFVKVKPLMDARDKARESKAAAEAALAKAQAVVAAVQKQLQELEDSFKEATEEKAAVEAEAAACNEKIGLANRLVNGLSSENARWGIEIERLRASSLTLIGDCMLSAAFVSYTGAFDGPIRVQLVEEIWKADLAAKMIPITEGVDPLSQLTDEGNNAKMMSEGLPSDRISIENGAIITRSARWPLIIDPQLQGIKWLREREAVNSVVVLQLTQNRWAATLTNAISNGTAIIVENLGQEIDATLDPVIARAIYKKGRNMYLKFGGEEVEYDMKFRMYLQTKLSNPHYKPEIAAQCTLVNFIATESGLEDQLLAKVVKEEQPAMEAEKQALVAAFQQYQIQLVDLEDNLLERLANAPDDILSDVPLIIGLEETKAASIMINEAVAKGKETEKAINIAREVYRRVACEGAMLYFMLTQLNFIDHMYQYSLDAFIIYFFKSIERATPAEALEQRVLNLRDALRLTIFTWVSRGLFVRHKLIYLSQLTFNLIRRGILTDVEMTPDQFNFLMRCPKKLAEENPLEWLPNASWLSINALCDLEEFSKFGSDVVEAAPRFREWYNHATPEREKLPLDWSSLDKTPFLKMMVVRCLRPDRMTVTVSDFILQTLPDGGSYVNCDGSLNSKSITDNSLMDSTPVTPLYFILSPGADVVGDLDALAVKYEMTAGSYHNISMGQGQDVVAEDKLEQAHRNGHWVILNNIHLMPSWLIQLEKKLDEFALEGSHPRFRLFLTSAPSTGIPIGILNRSIKLTNEPPAGLKANLKRAFCVFSKDQIDEADSKTKSILFGLCHFHAIMMERKLYGPLGYNMMYPFSTGDLKDSCVVLTNYMENTGGGKIPWEDLKYLFGEIMYGGHIVNDFDRLMCKCYLDWFMKDELLEETEMFPFAEDEKASFKSPLPTNYERYLEHMDTELHADTPVAFGLHPNAEIDFRTTQSDSLFTTLMDLQPKSAGAGDGGLSPQAVAEAVLAEVMDKFGEKAVDTEEIVRGIDEMGPYQNVFVQECSMVQVLLAEMKRSLKELTLGFAGELTMSDPMEELQDSLYLDRVYGGWAKKAWPSMRPLVGWLFNLGGRIAQLEEWTANPMEIPKVTWISGLITPQSFLTAINQVTAQKNQLELDKLIINTDVTKRSAAEVDTLSRDGAYIHGLSLQGARWDLPNNQLERAKPKEMFFAMPVLNCKGTLVDKAATSGVYQCPTYKTEQRGPTYVIEMQLTSKSPPAKWVLAGVAMIMDIIG